MRVNKQKLKGYKLTGSIHTLTIKSDDEIRNMDIPDEIVSCISSNVRSSKDAVESFSVINPNKLFGDIYNFSEFQTALGTITAAAGIAKYKLVRVDMRFDSYDPKHYREYAKLNRYLLSALAVTYRVRNAYRTENLFNCQQVSVAIKNDYFEAENYDRAAKTQNTENHIEPAQARLEERSKNKMWRIRYATCHGEISDEDNMKILCREFVEGWARRWENAIKNLDAVHKKYNCNLERIYKVGQSEYPKKFRSLTDFLIQYQDCIFCKAQMIDLLSRLPEVKNPESKAASHKKRYGIEYFSPEDVQQAVNEIRRATIEFFSK